MQPGRPVAPQPLHQRNAFHTGIGFTGNALAYVFVVGIAGLFVALLALECATVARERAGGPPARATATRVVAS